MTAFLPMVIFPCVYKIAPMVTDASSSISKFQGAHILTPGYTCTERPILAPKQEKAPGMQWLWRKPEEKG